MSGENQTITLLWNLGSFESRLKEINLDECSEVLNPADFLDQHYAKEYCCYPERLMYMKWIHERARFGTEGLPQDREQYYFERFSGLNLVTEQIRSWVMEWKKNIDELTYIRDNHKEFVDFWDMYIAHIKYWRYIFEDNQLSDEQQNIFRKAAEAIKGILKFETDEKVSGVERKLCEKLRKIVTSEDGILINISTVRSFANNAEEYLTQIQKRIANKSNCCKSMDKLMEDNTEYLKREGKQSKTTLAVNTGLYELKFSKRYEDDSKHLLTAGIQHMCNFCSDLFEFTEKVNSAIEELLLKMPKGKDEKWKQKVLREYRYNPTKRIKRCVALMIWGNEQYMAFSGFLDCENPYVQQWLDIGVGMGEYFKKISQKCYGATLICVDKNVAQNMRCFVLEPDFKPVSRGTLCEAIKRVRCVCEPHAEDEEEKIKRLQNEIKDMYACCERKLIAHLGKPTGKLPIKAKLFVAKEPCLNCFLALNDWIGNSKNISLVIDYPEQYKLK